MAPSRACFSEVRSRVNPDAHRRKRHDPGRAMARPAPVTSRSFHVLVVGGGVAGLEAVLALRELAGELVDVELVAPEHQFFYRPLAVLEPFGRRPRDRWELADLTRAAGARFTPDGGRGGRADVSRAGRCRAIQGAARRHQGGPCEAPGLRRPIRNRLAAPDL